MFKKRAAQVSCIALFLLTGYDLRADLIYGTIRFADTGRPANGVRLEIRCGGGEVYAGLVQPAGDYKIYVREQGTCTLRAMIGPADSVPRARIRSYDEPVRYDFDIVGGPNGYGLARK